MTPTAIPKLDDLITDPRKLAGVPSEAIPALRGELARLDTFLLARLLSGGNIQAETGPEGDRLLNAREASTKLGLSEDHLYRHSTQFPFTVRLGRKLRFSEAGIERYIRQRMCR
jgi:predicted DNA-binding transcriptional regulator AlpA